MRCNRRPLPLKATLDPLEPATNFLHLFAVDLTAAAGRKMEISGWVPARCQWRAG